MPRVPWTGRYAGSFGVWEVPLRRLFFPHFIGSNATDGSSQGTVPSDLDQESSSSAQDVDLLDPNQRDSAERNPSWSTGASVSTEQRVRRRASATASPATLGFLLLPQWLVDLQVCTYSVAVTA